jgi:hypothetical protein
MISTFDLILLGGLISIGGIGFLVRAHRRPPIGSRFEAATDQTGNTKAKRNEDRVRAEAMAGVRWLTVGALALLIGSTRGADSGYLFDLWADVAFHTVLLSGCWAATAVRIQRVGGRGAPRGRNAPASPVPRAGIATFER